MDLYYLAGTVALSNGCLGQADACFRAAIELIGDLPSRIEAEDGNVKSIDSYLLTYVPRLLTVLVVTPDSPDLGTLYLPNTLLEQLYATSPLFENPTTLTLLYLHMMDFYITICGETYPHRIPEVVSNDRLYGRDPKFIREVEGSCNQIVESLLEQFQELGETGQVKWQGQFALQLFQRIAFKSDLGEDKQFALAVNLWNLAMKNRAVLTDSQLPHRIVATMEERIRLYEGSVGEGGKVPAFVECLRNILPRLKKRL